MEANWNVEIEYKHVERFEPGSSESVAYLDQHGYVILKETLTKKEAENQLSKLIKKSLLVSTFLNCLAICGRHTVVS